MKLYDKIFFIGLISGFIFSMVVLFMIITGNSYSVEVIRTLGGTKAIMIPNKFFDYSVLGIFTSLLLIPIGLLGEKE